MPHSVVKCPVMYLNDSLRELVAERLGRFDNRGLSTAGSPRAAAGLAPIE